MRLQYVMHFPKGERYVSIVKEAADPAAQAKLESERNRLKAMIRHQLAESAMLAEADEGLGQPSAMVRCKLTWHDVSGSCSATPSSLTNEASCLQSDGPPVVQAA